MNHVRACRALGDDEPGGEAVTIATKRHPALTTTHIEALYAAIRFQ